MTGTNWDSRDEYTTDAGCGEVGGAGCEPDFTLDGLLNTVPTSRWSCALEMEYPETTSQGCNITYDLQASYSLASVNIYFYESNLLDRLPNEFDVYVSPDGLDYIFSFSAQNNLPLPLGTADVFDFPQGSSGQHVRIVGGAFTDDVTNDWLSINEVKVMINDAISTPTPTASSRGIPTSSPALDVPIPTDAPAITPATGSPTMEGGGSATCSSLTVSGASLLDGDYVGGVNANGATVYTSVSTAAATITTGEDVAVCDDSASASPCLHPLWTLTPADVDTYSSYIVYDEAKSPAYITEVWFRLAPACTGSSLPCSNSPARVEITCSDGSTGTPAPVTSTTSCEVLEVAGTQDGKLDGFYYNDGLLPDADITARVGAYFGYAADSSGELVSNGNKVESYDVAADCTSTSMSTSTCSFNEWRVRAISSSLSSTSSSAGFDYFAFDEADHPVDIESGRVWYTSSLTVVPYAEAITITCAPATAPSFPAASPITSSPSLSTSATTDDDDDLGAKDSPVVEPNSGDGGTNVPMIAGLAGGGMVVFLLIAGAVVYKVRNGPRSVPPPPSYDDIVGTS